MIIHILHDEQYDSMFMSSFGKVGRDSSRKEQVRCGGHVKFYYPNIEAEYYYVRGAVDHNNQCRMSTCTPAGSNCNCSIISCYNIILTLAMRCVVSGGLALEKSWGTKSWIVRCFTFLIALSESNAYCCWTKGVHPSPSDPEHTDFITFRRELAYQLLTMFAKSDSPKACSEEAVDLVFNGDSNGGQERPWRDPPRRP